MVAHYLYYSTILRMGLMAKPGFSPDVSGVFILFFLSHVKSAIHCLDKNRDKHPVGKLSCFEFMMVDVSDVLT